MTINPGKIRLASLVLATLLALPIPPGVFTGSFIWTSPFIHINAIISRQVFSWFNLIGLAIIILIFVKDRFYCRYLCPAGYLCDPVSTFARKRWGGKRFPNIARGILLLSLILALFGLPVLSLLDPVNAFNAFFDPFHTGFASLAIIKSSGLLIIVLINLVFPHSWCRRICPLGGLQFVATDIKKLFTGKRRSLNLNDRKNRRYFIVGALGAGTSLLVPGILKEGDRRMLRPPGIIPDLELGVVCSRCGNCLKACPTNIIRPQTSGGWMTIFTPTVDFSESYCLPECNRCGSVCPTGAIPAFSLEQKKKLFIGSAEIKADLCLLTKNQECDRCKFSCGFDAIEIRNYSNYSAIPVISKERCVGCGACQVACPENAITVTVNDTDHSD